MARNKKQNKLKVKTIGDNPNFTPKELEEKILGEFRNKDYQIDTIGWLGMTAVYKHFERIMMTLERNLRNGTAEKIGNETTKKKQIINKTYIIRETIGRDTKETNKI